MATPPRTCPHCDTRLSKWRVPDGASWDDEFFLVCFNDQCSYYREGWAWMLENYNQKASYRYSVSPSTGAASPLPVWSDKATREMIVNDTEAGDA